VYYDVLFLRNADAMLRLAGNLTNQLEVSKLHKIRISYRDQVHPSEGLDEGLEQKSTISLENLRTARFIAQVDRKFLICRVDATIEQHEAHKKSGVLGYIVAIDQHAAHERIRLEKVISQLLQGFICDDLKTVAISRDKQKVIVSQSESDTFRGIPAMTRLLCRWGMIVEGLKGYEGNTSENNDKDIYIQTVPEILANRFQGDSLELARTVRGFLGYLESIPVSSMLTETTDQINSHDPNKTITMQTALRLCPPRYRDLANSNACRGECLRQ
jgi:DNA mismatch repair ATPase MutL